MASLIEQGWEEKNKIHDSYSLAELAAFHQAKSVQDRLRREEWEISGEGSSIVSLSELDQKPVLTARSPLEYPIALQDELGPQQAKVEVVIGANGTPLDMRELPVNEGGLLPEALRPYLLKVVYGLRFKPGIRDGNPVATKMRMTIPFSVDFDPDDVFDSGEVDVRPRVIRQANAVYPHQLAMRQVKGKVVVAFILDDQGNVRRPRIVKSTHPLFNEPALEALKYSRYSPAEKNGRKVPSRVRQEVQFSP